MSVQGSPTVYQPPSFVVSSLTALARQGMTALAGILVAQSLLPQTSSDAFVQAGIGLALGALSYAWSLLEKRIHAKDAAQQLAVAVNVTKAGG